MRTVCLLLLALTLLGCDVLPATPTPLPATPTPPPPTATPLYTAAEARYLATVRAQIAAYRPDLLTVRAIVATPGPEPTVRARITHALATYRTWDAQAQQIVVPPRFAPLHARYLSATHHIGLYAELEAEIVSTPNDTSALQTQADLEFAAAQTDLLEFLSALPGATGTP